MIIYETSKELRRQLKAKGLYCSRPWLIDKEKKGLIHKPKTVLRLHKKTKGFSTEFAKLYTQQDIEIIINQILALRK